MVLYGFIVEMGATDVTKHLFQQYWFWIL